MASFITHDYEFVCTEGATYSVTTWKKYYRYFFIAITITKIATRIAVILTSTNLTRQPCWLYNFIAFENAKDFYTNRFNQLKTVWPMCMRPLIYYNFHLFIYEKKTVGTHIKLSLGATRENREPSTFPNERK